MMRRFRGNGVRPLNSDRGLIKEVGGIKEEIKGHFQSRFQKPCSKRPFIGECTSTSLIMASAILMKNLFCFEEIKYAIWSSKGDKSPRLDGFNMGIYKKFYDILKEDIVSFVN